MPVARNRRRHIADGLRVKAVHAHRCRAEQQHPYLKGPYRPRIQNFCKINCFPWRNKSSIACLETYPIASRRVNPHFPALQALEFSASPDLPGTIPSTRIVYNCFPVNRYDTKALSTPTLSSGRSGRSPALSRIPLSLAISDYDHVADLINGRIVPQGIDLTCLNLQIEETHFRALAFREFDVSELSFAKYASLISQGDDSLTAIPVFPLRMARHSSIYIRRDGPIQKPADLAGRRIGLPEWAQTASVYSRGFLVHQYGLDLASIDWIQAGVNQPGRVEKVKLKLPPGVKLTPAPEKSLSEMLLSGEIDAALTAHPPNCFLEGHPNVRRLFENYVDVEKSYIRETGIFPIMHIVAIKRELLDRHPWIAMNLFTAFEEAKNRSLERALFVGSRYPIPWGYEYARQAQELIGKDFWPYGMDANRKTLDAFLQYASSRASATAC